jgi:two-component system response regulator MprA
MERLARAKPHVVVLEVKLPAVDGTDLCRRIRYRPGGGEIAIIMLCERDGVADRVRGLEAGADDYVVKPFDLSEMLARVRAQLRRVWRPVPEVLRCADLELDSGQQIARRAGRPVHLTTTEFHLLGLFMRHPQQVLTRRAIGEHLWSVDFETGSNVIDVYVRRLRRKLEEQGEPALVHTVRGSGYVLRPPPDAAPAAR